MKSIYKALLGLLVLTAFGKLTAQDLASMYYYFNTSEQIREYIFTNLNNEFILGKNEEQFTTHFPEFADEIFQPLTCTGDFDGDGLDEVALFHRVRYRPNCFSPNCPSYYTANISLLKSHGKGFFAFGTWYDVIDSLLEPMMIRHALSGDYNGDGLDDIAILYKDTFVFPQKEHLAVFISNGSSFEAPQVFYDFSQNPYEIDNIHFAVSGDFNNNGTTDLAFIYHHSDSSSAKKEIVVFESDGSTFLPQIYAQIPDSLMLNEIHSVFAGKFNNDNLADIGIFCETAATVSNDSGKVIYVFENSSGSFSNPISYINLNNNIPDISQVLLSTSTDINSDGKTDIVYMYNPLSSSALQYKIMVLEATGTRLAAPQTYFEIDANEFNMLNCQHLVSGNFSSEADVSACIWKNNAPSALTFSFDDGFSETIENAKYLYTKKLRGTHNIISNESGNWLYVSWEDMRNDTLGNEFASHSHTHPFFNQIPLMASANELTASKAMLDDSLNQTTNSFVFPYGAFSYEILQLPEMRNNFLSARTSLEGYNLATPLNFYAMKSETVYDYTTAQDFIDRVEWSKQHNYWLFMMFHYIGYTGNDPDLLDYNVSISDFNAMVDYAFAQDIWVDTQEKITKYIKERNALKTKTYTLVDTHKILVKIEDGLDDAIYDEPLTIKLALPTAWNFDSLLIESDLGKSPSSVFTENGKKYIYFNALPNNGDVFIYPDILKSLEKNQPKVIDEFKLWPNPAANKVNIAIPNKYRGKSSVELFNTVGQHLTSIKSEDIGIAQIERSHFQAGLYFVVLKSEGQVIATKRLIFR